jgi:hypothetical protein
MRIRLKDAGAGEVSTSRLNRAGAFKATNAKGQVYWTCLSEGEVAAGFDVARWGAATSLQLTLARTPLASWHPRWAAASLRAEGLPGERFQDLKAVRNALRITQRRLTGLAQILRGDDRPGPLVEGRMWSESFAQWTVTNRGRKQLGIPFARPASDWAVMKLLGFATDIGVQIETQVLHPWAAHQPPGATPVLATAAEIAAKTTKDGRAITDRIESTFSTEPGCTVTVTPDLAVVHRDRFVAVHIAESRWRTDGLPDWDQVIAAYLANPNTVAVWIVCGSEGTRYAVDSTAHATANPRRVPVRTGLVETIGPVRQIAGFDAGSGWMEDLGALAAG